MVITHELLRKDRCEKGGRTNIDMREIFIPCFQEEEPCLLTITRESFSHSQQFKWPEQWRGQDCRGGQALLGKDTS